jgi:hypothetical protein
MNNEVLFRTAEYLAAGYFHNNIITVIDHNNAKITIRYKNWVDRNTKQMSYSDKISGKESPVFMSYFFHFIAREKF